MSTLRSWWARIVAGWRWLDLDVRDLHAYGGLGLLTWGLWQLYPPIAFVVAGVVLIIYALRTPG